MLIAIRDAAAQARVSLATVSLLCHNGIVTIGIDHGLRSTGLRIPEDMAVVGFGGIEDGLCLDIPLTAVHTPIDVVCGHVVALMVSRLNGEQRISPPQILVPTHLTPGGTA